MKEKYVVVYQTDNNDLYTKEFDSRQKVDKWLNKNELYKAQVITIKVQGEVDIEIEDHT